MPSENWSELYCSDLDTVPRPCEGSVLVTGATGYIGGSLIPEFLARGYTVRAMVRAPYADHELRWPGAELVVADASDVQALEQGLAGVHTAYYLIHSLLLGPRKFQERDLAYARNFREAAARCGVKRIIYLGGLGDVRTGLSPHLHSRSEVADELRRGSVSVTVLRAAIIIGSGSASYEIIRHLVRNVPIMPVPRWSRNQCQPIAIRDVVRYLVGVLETPETDGESLDIGGPDVLTYEDMLKQVARVFGYRRVFFSFPYSNLRFYAYVASLLTPVPAPITISLMEGLKNDVVCENDRIRQLIPFRTLSYRESIVDAMSREEQDRVHTRWSDAYPPAHELAIKLPEIDPPPRYTSSYALLTDSSASALFNSFCRVGGQEGWFHGNWMWRLRGLIDRIFAGVGTSRGRRSAAELRVNDVIDFWRVEDIVPNETLLLRAEMLLPGWAWLEFHIRHLGDRRRLEVTAYFSTSGFWGHVYWFIFVPFHIFIFRNLITQIERRSRGDS